MNQIDDVLEMFLFFAQALVLSAFITHLWFSALASAWALFLVGVILPPLGIIHGFAIWLGYTWF